MKSKIALSLWFGLVAFSINAQDGKIIKAEKKYDAYSYDEAINKYEGLTNLETDAKRNLADSYVKVGDFENAEIQYADLVQHSEATSEDIFQYASVLRINEKYAESQGWISKFNEREPNDSRGKEYVNNEGSHNQLLADQGIFVVRNLSVNTAQQDFGTSFYGNDMVVFASSREGAKMAKRRWNWNDMPFLDMYKSKRSESYDLSDLESFRGGMNKKYHEGPAAFNQAADYMIFTRNNYSGKSSDDVVKLQLYSSSKSKGKWTKPEPMSFNSDEHSVGHPTLSADGNTLYFASDMPGGMGGVDIYSSKRNEDGSWNNAMNMGPTVNTEGNEMFPFYHEDGFLFFASSGHVGLGGLDVFVAMLNEEGNAKKIENLGKPVNSNKDDFALILNKEQQKGYFSSNRDGGKGDDDIYSFNLSEPFENGMILKGFAVNGDGGVLAGSEVKLFNLTTNSDEGSVITDEYGNFEFDIDPDMNYKIVGAKEEYIEGITMTDSYVQGNVVEANVVLEKDPGIGLYCLVTDAKTKGPLRDVKVTMKNMNTGESEVIYTDLEGDFMRPLTDNKINDNIKYEFKFEKEGFLATTGLYEKKLTVPGMYNVHEELNVNMIPVNVGDDLGTLIDIDMIYFDFNKFNIRTDASVELNKIVKVMNDYPTMEIELGSHTDCRGTKSYNEWLSDERAKASAKYIKSKITNPSRIYGKGYGESEPANGCECEGSVKSDCSDEEHALNRRTEFKIIKM